MPDYADIDFNGGDHRQRKALRVALMRTFRSERSLAMFLDEELGFQLRDEVNDGPFKQQVYELIHLLAARGRLDDLMRRLFKSNEYAEAPALHDLLLAWGAVSTNEPEPGPERSEGARAPIESILDGDVRRMSGIHWMSGVAALTRRVCLLHTSGGLATGFLVAPDLVMTAAYVVHGAKDRKIEAVFDRGLRVAVGRPRALDPAPEADADGAHRDRYLGSLDYALLPLRRKLGEQRLEDDARRGWFDLTDARERLREGEQLFMFHHPQGGPVKLSVGVVGPAPDFDGRFAHNCFSEPGSGGAPLVDATLRFVGLQEMKGRDDADGDAWRIAVRADRLAAEIGRLGVALQSPPRREPA